MTRPAWNLDGSDGCLLLGVTGGIASGKTAVCDMLSEMGVPLIDFDVLARKVVEPGMPAWQDIVAFFGEGILDSNRKIDRKKLSGIVFQDRNKRRTLEAFTHPRIALQYIQELNEVRARHPNAVVQAAVPLLIEANLQHLFHKILVVFIPREIQIERLMRRDGIRREEAEAILAAQLPIEKKLQHADFVIDNSKSLDETRVEVQSLLKTLEHIRAG